MIRTLESGISSLILIIFILYFFYYIPEENLSKIGYNCLKDLDNKGILRYYDFDSLKEEIKKCLPNLNFELKVCETTYCPPEFSTDKNVFLISYLIEGDNEFKPTLINLWVWSI